MERRASSPAGTGVPAFASPTKLHRLQICVWSRISENPQHRDHLAFVVERVGYDV